MRDRGGRLQQRGWGLIHIAKAFGRRAIVTGKAGVCLPSGPTSQAAGQVSLRPGCPTPGKEAAVLLKFGHTCRCHHWTVPGPSSGTSFVKGQLNGVHGAPNPIKA